MDSTQSTESKKVYVEGHGCSASFADTEILRGMISRGGYELVEDESSADVSVLVTCSVKSVTEQRMLHRIEEMSAGSKRLVVAGCLPKADPEKIQKMRPDLSLLGPGNLDAILPAIESTLSGSKLISLQSNKLVKVGLPRSRLNNVVGIVEISSGCLSSCTFCQVKLVKGTVFSYPEDQIVEEARMMVSQGAKEIWLTSTDNAAYGRDTKTSLPSLIRRVSSIPGNFMIRIGMMNPLLTDRILEELIESFKHEKVYKFLHLPVQSGSDRILDAMKRGYTVEDFYRTVNLFRRSIPDITLSTDIIVAFPSESRVEFEESMELLRKVEPDVVNLSRFGARRGTKAAEMDFQVRNETAKLRSNQMTALIRQIARKRNERWIGWQGDVLIDESVKMAIVGRNYAYKPCLISNEVLTTEKPIGSVVRVKIFGATASTLRAKPD
ncbi:MAG: tRNA (N(6)-L-threonylcarbamoyladenosine(37)-C(2))-methylthiotransferase [Thaumarchaeota archaeon]|nr:tRNA (N(6)-L-threonylcarbamoyladenosine(37)-C(2))-methylthiotransferase [Nitrososphaerota archaeon]MDG6906587.1 tRNA (N(6)-L-threonylcarbamoyladenosine(37)-C(2))-methylthiotransferase [Nitrososphaerota archaeon]